MQFISENTIDRLLELYDNEDTFSEHLTVLFNEQPVAKNYLGDEEFKLLTQDELSLLHYLFTVIYHAVRTVHGVIKPVTAKVLEENEESNWDKFNAQTQKSFSRKLDIFFQDYPQEDLLALVEDSITPDEEGISPVGAEIIFVSCKSWIDSLHQSA